MLSKKAVALAVLVWLSALAGCGFLYDRLYYASMEKLGREKRDILAKRVTAGREEQEKAKEQFQTTLEAFQSLTGFEGGDLERVYNKLDKEYQRSENRAKDVHERVNSIEKVAEDLFREWDQEISEIGSANLRRQSQALLADTQQGYKTLIAKMRHSI